MLRIFWRCLRPRASPKNRNFIKNIMLSIRHELLISAPLDKIVTAITTQHGLSSWWTKTEMLPEHGAIRFHFGERYFKEMKIVQSGFPQIEWQCIAGADEWIGTTLSFQIESEEKDLMLATHPEVAGQMVQQNTNSPALLLFQHENWRAQTPMFAECNYTWAMFLRSLKSYCETGIGKPFPNQHK